MHPCFLEAELLVDHPKWMLDLGVGVCLGSLDQILQPTIGSFSECSAFARAHRSLEIRCIARDVDPKTELDLLKASLSA